MYCPTCRTQVPDGTKFCGKCGTPCVSSPAPNGGGAYGGGNGPEKSNKGLVIAIIVVSVIVVIAAIVAGVLAFTHSKKEKEPETTKASVTQQVQEEDSTEAAEEQTETNGVVTNKNNNPPVTREKDGMGVDTDAIGYIVDSYGSSTNSSVAIYNLNTGDFYQKNGKKKQVASALILFPIANTYATLIDNGYEDMYAEYPLVFKGEPGRSTFEKSDRGNYYSVHEYFKRAFSSSDNNAINSLIDPYAFSEFELKCSNYTSFEMNKYLAVPSGKDNYISASDLAEMIYNLYNGGGAGKEFIDMMPSRVADEKGKLGAYTCSGVYRDFNAWTTTRFHEVSFIEGSSGDDYLMVYMSDGKSYSKGAQAAKEIGQVF